MYKYIVDAIDQEADEILKESSDTQTKTRVLYGILREVSTQVGELMGLDNEKRRQEE